MVRYLTFTDTRQVKAQECRAAKDTGKMTGGKEFWVTPGMTILQSTFLHVDLTNNSYYSNEVLEMLGGRKIGGQATQAKYEIMMLDEYAKLNNLTGIIAVSEGTAKAANSLTDPMEGTYMWTHSEASAKHLGSAVQGHNQDLLQPDNLAGRRPGLDGGQAEGAGGWL